VPHAVGMHAVHVLPVLAWLLSFTVLSQWRRLRLVVAACIGYLGLLAVVAAQTFAGLVPWDLTRGRCWPARRR
jgi:hypothetical protein